MFSVIKYRAIDYVLEASAKQRLTLSCLVLPVPYHFSSHVPYLHSGTLPDTSYRRPWSDACKLPITGSVLDDFSSKVQAMDSLERFAVIVTQMEEGALEVIPSSNPASQACLSEDEALWLMAQRGKCLPLDEAFSRSSVKKMYKNHEAHFILEEVLFIDPVVQFRKDLKPELQNILSRCRTLVVPDPLLASQAGALSQEFMFGHLVLYDGSSVQPVQTELMPEFTEDFTKVPLLTEESLMLPVEVETNFPLTEAHRPSVANLTHMLNIGPALVEDQTTCMDIFKTPPAGNLQEIPDFKTSITPTLESLSLLNPSAPGHCRTYADLEMDFTLSPPHRPESLLARLPSFELQIEQLSPGSRQQFLPEDEKRNIEHAVWMSEKHHLSVARFVLAEPLLCIPALCNAPIAEVSRLLGIKSSDSINVQSQLHLLESECLVRGHSEFTENMSADKVVTEKGGSFLREDFLPLSHMQIDELLTKASQAVETKVEHKDKSDQMEVSPVVVQNLQDQQEGVDGEEHPYNIYCVPESYFTRIESEVAPSTRVRKVCQSVFLKGQDDLDPLSSFMALRIQQNLPQQNISNISESQKTREQMPTEGVTFKSPQLKSKESCNVDAVSCEGNRNTTGVIPVEASESQIQALRELCVLAERCLSRARDLGLRTSSCRDFGCMSADFSRFLLSQQEREQRVRPGQEALYHEVFTLHTLVMVKELVLKIDVSTAVDYLLQTKEDNSSVSLDQLAKKLKVLHYLSQRNKECNPKLQELQHQMKAWLQASGTQKPPSKVLVVITVDSNPLREMLITQLSGDVYAVVPAENNNFVDCRRVMESLKYSSCLVVCSRHIGADFPWHCFSVLVEYDDVESSRWTAVCRQMNICHMAFTTVSPISDPTITSSPLPFVKNVPFVLFVTEGLVNLSHLLQMLESVFNITVIERRLSPSLQMLEASHSYVVITVDESTAVLIQDLAELLINGASETVVMRLTVLSLQYSCCWLIFHVPTTQCSVISTEIYNNLVLTYSAVVLFGAKSEDLDVKVFFVSEEEDMASLIYHIAYHSMMSSERDPLSWLDREWLSVLPSDEESCLLLFPCITPLVAQLMLKRAASLQWLLGASFTELQDLLPEVPHKVIKFFSDITSLYILNSEPDVHLNEAGSSSDLWPISSEGPQEEKEMSHLHHRNSYTHLSPCSELESHFPEETTVLGHDLEADFRSAEVPSEWLGCHQWTGGDESITAKEWMRRMSPAQQVYSPRLGETQIYSPSSVPQLSPEFQNNTPSPLLSSVHPLTCHTSSPWRSHFSSSPSCSSGFRAGMERKRMSEITWTGFPLNKKGKLAYEKVPGRIDGQTRLAFL